MAQAGLETLYQHLGPATASAILGQREYDANQTQDIADQEKRGLIAKQQADAAHAVNMNPLLVENQQQTNAGLGLSNIGKGILNTTGTLANQVSQATQPGVIEGTNAENKGKVGKEQLETMTRVADMAGQLGIKLEQTPPLERQFVVKQFMETYGIPPNSEIGTMITKTPIENLPGILQTMKIQLNRSTKEHTQAMDVAKERTASDKYTADSHAASSKYSADSSAATARASIVARAQAKVVDPNVIASKLGYEKGAVYYTIQSENAETPKEKEQFLNLAKKFELMGKNQGNARAGTTASLNALGIATNPVTSALDNGPEAGTPGKIIDLR